jgi:peptidoglycan/LPS O-acetylase OafA/YrhL
LWLGKHSFAVYLVHGTILRTVGIWIVWGITGEPWSKAEKEEEQEWLHVISGGRKRVAVLAFVGLTYLAAWAWMKWVDTACARATIWLERRVFDDDGDGKEQKEGLAEKGYGHGPNGQIVLKS